MTEKIEWNLDDILKVKDFDNLAKEIRKDVGELKNDFKELRPNMKEDDFKRIILKVENVAEKASRLNYLPGLIKASNEKDSEAVFMESKANNLSSEYTKIVRKLHYWMKGMRVEGLKRLDKQNAKRLFKTIPDLTYKWQYLRLAAKHTLNENQEDIIVNKDMNGMDQLVSLRQIVETEMEYKLKIKNKELTIKTTAELSKYFYSAKSEEREGAYRAMLGQYEKNIDKLFLIYQSVVKDWGYESRLRKYPSPISVRNFNNQISDQIIEVLLEVCRKNRTIFQKYFEYKAKSLGMKKLRRYDIYAPINKIERKYSWQEAKDLVLTTLESFSPEFKNMAEVIWDKKHIDLLPNKNKRGGAFCATVSNKIEPYVLLNFTGQSRDVLTMAHELGHGIHSMLSAHHHLSVQHASLPLAETASTLAETIMFEKLYEEEKNETVKKGMINEMMGDMYATILRQNYFVLFEIEAHGKLNEGMRREDLSELYYQNLKEQFGSAVEIDPLFKYEWSYVNHLTASPFYCYAYNFGQLMSLALYSAYKKEGKEMVSKIEKILAAGSSRSTEDILKEVGIDINKAEFWQGSFDIINKWMKKLEAKS